MLTTQTLKKWGNATGIRLPQKIIKAAHLELDQELQISIKGRSVILTPLEQKHKPTLQEIFKDVSPADVGGEMDWGLDVGKERYE